MSNHLRALAAVLALLTLPAAEAQQPAPPAAAKAPTKAERMIRYRQAGFGWLGYNIGPLGAMAKGQIPFDAKVAQRNAATMAAIAPRLLEGFAPDTASGAPTRAKPEIWQNLDDFGAKMADLERATADLAEAARSGDLAQIGPALNKTGAACKACHDKYKTENLK